MQRGAKTVFPVEDNYPFWQTDIFENEDFPRMHFIENHYSGDCTNWWIPNRACVEAMLRSSGFDIADHPEEEVYICRRRESRSQEAPID
jgi:tRNA (mo5U34)-methyltransferase